MFFSIRDYQNELFDQIVTNYSEKNISILKFGYIKLSGTMNMKNYCQLDFDCTITEDGTGNIDHYKTYSGILVSGRLGLQRFHSLVGYDYPKREPRQVWIAKGLESSRSQLDFTSSSPFRNLFNWSISLSSKATIKDSYALFPEREQKKPMAEIIEKIKSLKKDKSFCWIVSQCRVYNDRFDLASKIINALPEPTHMWGSAASTCMPKVHRDKILNHGPIPRNENSNEIINGCKFYFSFENSNCSEYVTEKFSNALMGYAVPIVNGWRHTYEQTLPHSFIHVDHFLPNDISRLASYLDYLLKNETAYFHYFKWRQQKDILAKTSDEDLMYPTTCEVCKRVSRSIEQSARGIKMHQSIRDLGHHFSQLHKCSSI